MKNSVVILLVLIISCNRTTETDPVILQQADFFKVIAANDIALNEPREGEWRYMHKEPGQTFEQYKAANPIHPTSEMHEIYLAPIGKFSPQEYKILTYTAEYLKAFFQLRVAIITPVSDSIIPAAARRMRADGAEQLLAPYILDSILKHRQPVKAIVLMAITEKDLYPKNDWNYIFGLASYHDRIGVSSIKRLYHNLNDSANFKQCLSRMISVTSHEIGHMFSLQHCINAKCVMNGSNSLEETDTQPNRLCAECLKKLYWNFRFDNKARLKALLEYFQQHALERDYLLMKADYANIK